MENINIITKENNVEKHVYSSFSCVQKEERKKEKDENTKEYMMENERQKK